tara:strand:+ start:660 stop:1337 length:678 start_codon:yes stop_codon:yes gene_type:complete
MKKIVTLGCILLSFCSDAADKKKSIESASDSLRQKVSRQEGFIADFQQQVFDEKNKLLLTNTGQVAFDKPNKFYWHTVKPESLIVSDSKSVYVYDPELEHVNILSIDASLASTPFALLIKHNHLKVWNDYLVKKDKNCYQVQPQKMKGNLERLDLCFEAHKLVSFTTYDVQKSHSVFKLSKHKKIRSKDKNLFYFTIPKGTQISDERKQAPSKNKTPLIQDKKVK